MPRRAVLALSGAAFGVALLIITWFLAFHLGIAERADQSIYSGFGTLGQHPRLGSVATFIAELCNPTPYVYLAALPFGVALARRRIWAAITIGGILLGANVTTQLLKPLLATPRAAGLLAGHKTVSPASWPSGHATAAMALALCCVLAAPARLRPLASALGAAFAVAVSYSFLSLQWHYPSDVIGGFLVAATWSLVGMAAVFVADSRRRNPAAGEKPVRLSLQETLGPPALALAGALLLALVVVIARPHEVVSYARLHHTFVVGAAAIAAAAMAVATGVTLVLRR
ncbi:MAG: phosphatase PAP2 family protein [Solirubrobacteraceae bacterium]